MFFSDPSESDEGPPTKIRKTDDSEDGGGVGRKGRVRKKSAKLLEMEEFEQAEKSSSSVKKGKTAKTALVSGPNSEPADVSALNKKSKAATSAVGMSLESTPVSRKTAGRSVPAELTLRTSSMMLSSGDNLPSQIHAQEDIKPEVPINSPVLTTATTIKQECATTMKQECTATMKQEITTTMKQEDPKSVIKYLLSSPAAGSSHQLTTGLTRPLSQENSGSTTIPSKKASKKMKFDDKNSSGSKPKEKKMKIEIMSPSELGPPISSTPKIDSKTPSLKMKITSGSNPMTAQVAIESGDSGVGQTPKPKKASKKSKTPTVTNDDVKLEIADGGSDKIPKKKKVSKKKEKLILDAISAAQQTPTLASMVSGPQTQALRLGDSPSPLAVQKSTKKKLKTSSPGLSKKDANTSNSLVMDFDDAQDPSMEEDEVEESTLVIAETEKKKKKVMGKKKGLKEKDGLVSPKAEKEKKIPKRAPTAYMLFCNAHRPAIVEENPGIEFASISRKLGELWQMQSNKQKLQWRRKAQRRMKKSNLISTGKVGKESQGGSSASTVSATPQGTAALISTNQKLALMLQKSKPVTIDEGPISPTKVCIETDVEHDDSYNFSIEPLDVAAHLKLLGESLSIIGMRLQEHKGMIAVQGSLSVLLDSLLCACGPLLCLTQQVPGMDGCSPSVHAQTLDSVAYVMPGL